MSHLQLHKNGDTASADFTEEGMETPPTLKSWREVLSFDSRLETFRSMDKLSSESQRVRQDKERVLAERKLSARLRTSSCCSLGSQTDLSTSGGTSCGESICSSIDNRSSIPCLSCGSAGRPDGQEKEKKGGSKHRSNSSHCILTQNDDLQPQHASAPARPAMVQHPADEASGGSLLLEARHMHFIIHDDDTPALKTPDVAGGGVVKTGLPLPDTWFLMNEYESQLTTSTELPTLGRTWMKDAPRCAICTSKFGLFTRRHHCRRCGRNVCNACSPYRVHLRAPLSHPFKADRGPCRVCVGCHEPL